MQQALQTSGLTEASLTLIGNDHGTAKSDAWPVLCNPEIVVLWQSFLNGEPLVLVPVAKSELAPFEVQVAQFIELRHFQVLNWRS